MEPKTVINSAIALFLLGAIGSLGVSAMLSYTPSNATVAAVWIVCIVIAVVGIAITFIQ